MKKKCKKILKNLENVGGIKKIQNFYDFYFYPFLKSMVEPENLEKIILGIFQILLACLQFSGSVPQLYKSLPFFHELVYSPFGFFFSNPDRTYIFYLLAQELIVLRSHIFKFSLIVRYSILYIMTLEFLFYCIINWWDILCNFENDLIFKVHVDRAFSTELCLTLFAIYFCIYLYSYIRALNRKLPVFPNPILQKIPDSVAFWLQIKPETATKKKKK